MSAQDDLWNRWEGFLAKIGERQRDIFVEAEEGIREIIESFPEDPAPIGNAIQGLRFRIDELRTKVNDTWDKQVSPKFEEQGGAFRDRGLDRRVDFLQTLDEAWGLFAARMMAEFYRNLQPRAVAGGNKPVNCGTCGASMQLPTRKDTVSHKCSHCGALNQVMAERAVALYQGAGHANADLESLPLRHAIERFRIQVDRQRRAANWAPEPVESLDKWLAMERAYWEKFAAVKAQTLGGAPDSELVESRVGFFVEHTLKTDQRWRKAKGL